MPIPFACISRDHTDARLDERERIAFAPDAAAELLRALRDEDGVEEAVLVSTCNRTGLYLAGSDDPDTAAARRRLGAATDPAFWRPGAAGVRHGAEAVRRLFRVAAGLESRIRGESQILGQVKAAYRQACAVGTNGFYTNEIFHRAFRLGKRIRTETGFSAGSASVGAAAVADALRRVGPLAGLDILVVGAGEIASLVLRELAPARPERIRLANRSRHGAAALARETGCACIGLDTLPEALAQADLVFSATAAPEPILRPEMLPARAGRPLVLYDLALPRDIAPGVADAADVTLVTIDDLPSAPGASGASGADAADVVARVETLVEDAIADALAWHEELAAVPSIRRLLRNARTEGVRLRRLLRERVADADEPAVEREVRRITQRFLHQAVSELKETARQSAARVAERERRRRDRAPAESTSRGDNT